MADFGSASGNGQLLVSTSGIAGTGEFLEVHTQNNFSTPASSGVPGGVSGPASGLNNLAPGDFSGYSDPSAYGTVSSGGAVAPTFLNFQSTLPNVMFRFKNPA